MNEQLITGVETNNPLGTAVENVITRNPEQEEKAKVLASIIKVSSLPPLSPEETAELLQQIA